MRPGVMLAAAVVLPSLLFGGMLHHDNTMRRDALRDDGAVATMLAREQTLRVIEGAVLAIDRAEDATAGMSWSQIQARRGTVQNDLRRIEASQAQSLALLALVRPDGRVAVVGGPDQTPNADASGFEALRMARESSRALTFEAAPRHLAAQGAGLVIGRGRAAEGRPFDGLVLALVRADAFLGAWMRDGLRPGARFALVRDDGTVLLRQGDTSDTPGVLSADDPVRQAIAAQHTQADPLAADPFGDGQTQLVSWRRVGSLPLTIVYTLPGRRNSGSPS
jgi:hypothetical protein